MLLNKPMTETEKIEYYLGKDRFRDIYFKAEFPHAYQDIHAVDIKPEEYTNCVKKMNSVYRDMEFKFNKQGYRSNWDYNIEELKEKDNIILCLGCTDTFGMNVYYDDLWATKLQNKIPDATVMNCGIIGASPETIHRFLVKVTQVLPTQISHICLLWPHSARREFVSKTFTNIIKASDYNNIPMEDYWSYIDWKSDNYNFFKNYHAVKSICDAKNIKLYDLNINRFDKKVPYDFSSPMFAFGSKTHHAISEYFYKKVKDLPSLFEEQKR